MKAFQTLLDRINAAKDAECLNRLDKRITAHYNLGTISARELKRLDVRIMERIAKIETQ